VKVGKRAQAALLLAAAGIVAAVVAVRLWHRTEPDSYSVRATRKRADRLRGQVDQSEKDAALAVESYRPADGARLEDLAADAAALLRRLPGVARVDVAVNAERPTARIVHLLDWHAVPREMFAADLRADAGRTLTEEEAQALHDELLLQVELVQIEQGAALRCLVKRHGLKRVLAEGLTHAGKPGYDTLIDALRRAEADAGELRRQLDEVRRLKSEKARALEAEVVALLVRHRADYRQRFLEAGAAGRLLVAGELSQVLALDDANLLEAARPVSPDGTVRDDPAKVRAREVAQVRAALASGPAAVIVLGGAHDLAGSVRRVGKGSCEYLRVATPHYVEFGEAERAGRGPAR
jgi:hypothetical protein